MAVATGQRDSQQAIGDPATAETITTRCLLSHRYEGDRPPVAADEGKLQCARFGGEEFVIVCRHSSPEGCRGMAEKLRTEIAGHGFPKVGQVTASFGVAACRDGDSAATLLARADAALYRAKAGGRNRTSPSTASPDHHQAGR